MTRRALTILPVLVMLLVSAQWIAMQDAYPEWQFPRSVWMHSSMAIAPLVWFAAGLAIRRALKDRAPSWTKLRGALLPFAIVAGVVVNIALFDRYQVKAEFYRLEQHVRGTLLDVAKADPEHPFLFYYQLGEALPAGSSLAFGPETGLGAFELRFAAQVEPENIDAGAKLSAAMMSALDGDHALELAFKDRTAIIARAVASKKFACVLSEDERRLYIAPIEALGR